MKSSRKLPRHRSASRTGVLSARWAALLLGALQSLDAQSVFQETFTGTSATGWDFGGTGYTPNLTAASGVDTDGSGWLRLTSNAGNLSTYALLDTQIFSVGAQIQITMDYAFYNGSGADGITFFLVDGTTNIGSFTAGAYGGSLGYAQKDQAATGITGGVAGMKGGYLGFGFDNFGNYSNPTEGRVGGTGSVPNAIAVRGPESSNFAFINGSGPLQNLTGGGQMDFPTYTTRPVQTGADYRSFRLTLDANNLLVVEMKFGASNDYVVVFTSNLAGYIRPDTFKVGFTGATGGNTEIHEIRNLSVVTTPNATIGGSFEWDDGLNSSVDNWGLKDPAASGGETNTNWFAIDIAPTTNNNKTPLIDSDIFFGSRPANTSAGVAARPSPYASIQNVNLANDVQVRSLNFNSKYDYQLGGVGTIILGNTSKAGTPSIAVTDSIANPRFHKIDNALTVLENLVVGNQSHSTLTLNGAMNLGSNTLATVGAGQTNFNGVITGSGPIIATGASPNGRDSTGIVTINNDNSSSYTGTITINGGQVVVLNNGALGTTTTGTTVNYGGTLTFRGGITTSEPLNIKGPGTALSEIWDAGAIYNDGGINVLNGAVTLGDNTTIRSRAGNLTLSGVVGGAYSLTKTGDGVLTLSNASNTYSGSTVIQGGALRVTDPAALPGGFATGGTSGGNLTLNGGVLEIGTATTFTRQVGTGADQVRWTGDGGFSAYDTTAGTTRTVTLTSGPNTPSPNTAGGQLKWNTDGFVGTGSALLLSSDSSNGTVNFTNAIDLNGAAREVRVANGSAAVDATLSGVLSNGGLVKTGDGTLDVGTGNTYTGATVIQAGALRGTVSTSNVQLNGGVLELAANYTSALGTGAGQIQWTGGGGLAALSGTQTVNVGNNGQTLTWGGTTSNSLYFVRDASSLVLGSSSAAGTLVVTNAIALGSAARTIEMRDGSATTDASLNGIISGSAALNVVGAGRLELTGNNTYTGATTINGAEVLLSGSGDIAQSSSVTINGGGTLTLDNTTATVDRVGAGNITLNAGRISMLGFTSDSSETLGALQLTGGSNRVNVQTHATTTRDTDLTFVSLSRNAGATIEFTKESGGGTFGSTANNNPTISFTTAPTLDQSILAYAVAGDGATPTGFATYSGTSNVTITANTGANTLQGSWGASTIAANTADQQLTGNRTVGALILGSGIDITQDSTARTLTVQTGGILATGSTGSTGSTISTSTLNVGGTGARELITHVYGTGGLNISSAIVNNSNTTGLTKSGDGTLTLSGTTANSYSGTTTVNAGTLELNKSGGATAIAGNLVIGDTSGIDTVKILANEQIADTATVTLRGGTLLNNSNQAVLDIGNSLETFATLAVTGNSVVDFSGGSPSAPSFLVISSFATMGTSDLLTIRNWIDGADYFLIAKTGFDTTGEQANINRIIFDGYGTATWEEYSSDYFMITPHASPVPEPAAYGLLSLGGLAGFALLRRRRRSHA